MNLWEVIDQTVHALYVFMRFSIIFPLYALYQLHEINSGQIGILTGGALYFKTTNKGP